jgi:hypothetical protein
LTVETKSSLITEGTRKAELTAANNPAHRLDSLSTSEQNRVIAEICKEIEAAATR